MGERLLHTVNIVFMLWCVGVSVFACLGSIFGIVLFGDGCGFEFLIPCLGFETVSFFGLGCFLVAVGMGAVEFYSMRLHRAKPIAFIAVQNIHMR